MDAAKREELGRLAHAIAHNGQSKEWLWNACHEETKEAYRQMAVAGYRRAIADAAAIARQHECPATVEAIEALAE